MRLALFANSAGLEIGPRYGALIDKPAFSIGWGRFEGGPESRTQEAKMAAMQDRTGSGARWATIVVLFCLVVVLISASALTHDYWILGIFFSSALGLVAGVACHEFGHMSCAALLSLPIRVISIGSGPLLWRGRIGETRFEQRVLKGEVPHRRKFITPQIRLAR